MRNFITNTIVQFIDKYCKENNLENIWEKPIVGFADANSKSKWSQRNIAYAAGIGTFGINNMLISNVGSCGRYFSIVTDLDVKADEPLKEERCKYKVDKTCGVCVERCEVEALTYEGFNRFKCSKNCKKC